MGRDSINPPDQSGQILALAKQFIAIASTAGNDEALQAILQLALSQLTEYTIERFEKNGSPSALVYASSSRPKEFAVMLNAHLDVVPGKTEQYRPRVSNGRLYGTGALDMKANAACLIFAFKEMAKRVDYPLGLQLVTDEETGGFNGTGHQIAQGVQTRFVIAGEATGFNIVNKSKGVIWAQITCAGRTAHSAYPWSGENAIWKMHDFLTLLRQAYPSLDKEAWATTVTVSRIETDNTAYNKIPDSCTAWLDVRYVPEESDTILNSLKKLLPPDFTLQVVIHEPAHAANADSPQIQRLRRISQRVTKKKISIYGANGSSDARHFMRVGCDGVEFGAAGGAIGTDHEWVSLASLPQYYRILTEFLEAI